uniref:Uncharacterized protein n=1 Tax=Mimiviridae sp. ChoanoV1 TaxID=2596887 RepID=A0A5B8IGA0_9VIRU|nr:hypothetical protein 3_86 [Mimiviridae sp. ChoanoV1]
MSFDVKYNKLINQVPNQDLTNFLGLVNTEEEKSSIKFIRAFDYLYLTFKFFKVKNRELSEFIKTFDIGLPFEINQIIAKHILEEYEIKLNIIMFFSRNYPYNRPHCDLIEVQTNFNSNVNFETYYKLICNMNNQKEWNMSVTIDKDILDLYLSLDKIDYLIENIII